MRRALLVLLIAVAPLASAFGGASAATPVPRPAAPKADVDRWIAEDAAALRRAPSGATRERVTRFASLLNGLWLAGRDGELARELANASDRGPAAAAALPLLPGVDVRDAPPRPLSRGGRRALGGERLSRAPAAGRRPGGVKAVSVRQRGGNLGVPNGF